MKYPRNPVRTYTVTWLALLALLLLTTLLGFVDLGILSVPISIIIAIAMAILIVGLFMHGIYESKVIWVVIATGVVWIIFMISNTVGDYATRGWFYATGK